MMNGSFLGGAEKGPSFRIVKAGDSRGVSNVNSRTGVRFGDDLKVHSALRLCDSISVIFISLLRRNFSHSKLFLAFDKSCGMISALHNVGLALLPQGSYKI